MIAIANTPSLKATMRENSIAPRGPSGTCALRPGFHTGIIGAGHDGFRA